MYKTVMIGLLSGIALAAQAEVSVSDCVIQEVIPPKQMTGAFLTLENTGENTAILLSAEAPSITEHVELHEMAVVDDVMSMREIPQYDVTPGEHFFQKGSYHVMLMDIENTPVVGEAYEITLQFEDGSSLSCDADVLSVDEVMANYAKEGAMEHNHGMMEHDHSEHEHGEMEHNHDHGEHNMEMDEEVIVESAQS